ncbi:hypothetical protein [Xanthomonas oryzae]|uniref:hypothetical protein n=1 Tax=Xanthomonas oryzae TaxID=347 RepID=UPI00046456A5|nr:hypothetical protein [Xanthomonas oryzae]AVT99553.1 hypothetical protein C0L89_13265 [Xanthomonas oryzae pv. oryzae]QBN28842.1 hypothetical protein EBA01_13270 [Xanthomonas oryzae pv. oryzae]QBN32082.1 hypothetical protein EBA02_10535 [Xanthomonas oryzae pv. oryzae]QBN61588.1 hypothetical protein EBA10_13300 [Xanthomonas oryzae pv. oryzae]QBN65226.1 hypothetical protein EBA11_13230 [Xanthomonas oryzae pv. oryzae]
MTVARAAGCNFVATCNALPALQWLECCVDGVHGLWQSRIVQPLFQASAQNPGAVAIEVARSCFHVARSSQRAGAAQQVPVTQH